MRLILIIIFIASLWGIVWAMIGYPLSLLALRRLITRKNTQDYAMEPTVTLMIVAHNEEKVIKNKLLNTSSIVYPNDKLEILVTSDNSTDATNDIVKEFMRVNPDRNIKLYKVQERKGKLNAQNEAKRIVDSEYIVFTDANSILDPNCVKELMASFTSDDIAYVCGRLVYMNADTTDVSNAETSYWDLDITMRDIESNIRTITAGNGALYACRTEDYYDFDLIESHDSAMPIHFGLQNRRAIMNSKAIAVEKAGESMGDEFGRKVRMNRVLLRHIMPDIRILNVFRYRWFTYFYLGHRTARYLLWLNHILLLLANILLTPGSLWFGIVLAAQLLFLIIAGMYRIFKVNNKLTRMVAYYVMTIVAQIVGVYRIITGKAKPFWEKAESTR